jgi:hypothetical protein
MTDRLRCLAGWPRWVTIDPTGGDPFMGGPVYIQVCAHCRHERGSHPR